MELLGWIATLISTIGIVLNAKKLFIAGLFGLLAIYYG
jgi:hypothetical protein